MKYEIIRLLLKCAWQTFTGALILDCIRQTTERIDVGLWRKHQFEKMYKVDTNKGGNNG